MGLRDLFRRGDTASPEVPEHGTPEHGVAAESTREHEHAHMHDDDGCGPVGPRVPADAPAQRVAPTPSGPPADTVLMRSFELKLAVLQPLMYEPGAVLPAFSMPASMHPGRPVEDWFRGFTVTADQLSAVTSLTLSRGNEVYRQVDPHWPADDARFDVVDVSARDLDALPNLRSVHDAEGMIGASAREAIAARGVVIA